MDCERLCHVPGTAGVIEGSGVEDARGFVKAMRIAAFESTVAAFDGAAARTAKAGSFDGALAVVACRLETPTNTPAPMITTAATTAPIIQGFLECVAFDAC